LIAQRKVIMRDSRHEAACKAIPGLCLSPVFTSAGTANALGQNAQPIHASQNWEYTVTAEMNAPAAHGE
jgi:hypothetical protein